MATKELKFYGPIASENVLTPSNQSKPVMTLNYISITGNDANSDSLYVICPKTYMQPEKFDVVKINAYWYTVTGYHRVWIDDVFSEGIRIDLQKNLLETGIRNIIKYDYSFFLKQPGNLTLGETEAPPWPYDPALVNAPMTSLDTRVTNCDGALQIVALAPEFIGDRGEESKPTAFSIGDEINLNSIYTNHGQGEGGSILTTFFDKVKNLEQLLQGATIEYGFTNLAFKYPKEVISQEKNEMKFQDTNVNENLSFSLPSFLKQTGGTFRVAVANEFTEIPVDNSIPFILDSVEEFKNNLGIITRVRLGDRSFSIPHADISAPVNQVLADTLRLQAMGDVDLDQFLTSLALVVGNAVSASSNGILSALGGLVTSMIPEEYRTNFGYALMNAITKDDNNGEGFITQQQKALSTQGITGGLLVDSSAEFSYTYQLPEFVGRVSDLTMFKIRASNLFSSSDVGVMKRSAEIAQSTESDTPDAISTALDWISSGFYCNSGVISSKPTDPVDIGDVETDAPVDLTATDAYKSGVTEGSADPVGTGHSAYYAQYYIQYYGLTTSNPNGYDNIEGRDDWTYKLKHKYDIPADISSDRSPLFCFAYGYRDAAISKYKKDEKTYKGPLNSPSDLFAGDNAEENFISACDKYLEANPDAKKQP